MSAHYDNVLSGTRTLLERIAADFSPAVFASSLAAEDMVITDLILRAKLPITIFTLETGRLHAETLGMIDRIRETYDYDVALYKPEATAIASYVAANGLNAFYDSIEMRKECCRIRKVEPLKRALAGNKAWITGQRRAQSTTRSELAVQEHDTAHGLQKFNPLADWDKARIEAYFAEHNLPRHPLEAQGYLSIGCQPCTSQVQPGEDPRAGRWRHWDKTECGIHNQPAF
jgi:phosphoadenosine phosphosulfate reductase